MRASKSWSALLLVACFGCAGSLETPPLPADASALSAINHFGIRRDHHAGRAPLPHVVVIKDRHSARAGFHRVRPQLQEIQREHRLLVTHLVGLGYDLLACEQPLGPLADRKETAAEFRVIRQRLRPVEDLDEYGVFQPLRFAMLHEGRLTVVGIEDPELYAADHDAWEEFIEGTRKGKRNDRPPEERALWLERAALASRRLDRNVLPRGRAAGRNLVALMRERGSQRAVLMIGGAHVPGVVDALREADIAFDVFESAGYAGPQVP